jgi:hypothetical protein
LYEQKEEKNPPKNILKKEKVAWHPSADFLLPSVRGGGDFVDTVIAVKMI